jgi:hypothetical protein
MVMAKQVTGALALVLFLVTLSAPALAHTDPQPTVQIIALHGERPVKEVDTTITLRAFADDAGFMSGVISIELYEDGKFLARHFCSGTPCTADFTVSHELKGRHTYTARAKDRGDNTRSATVGVIFLGRDHPPLLTFEERPYAEENYPLNLPVIGEDKNRLSVAVTASNLPRGAVFDGSYLRWTPDFDQSGTHRITFTATNSLGLKTTKTMTIDVKDVNRPPEIVSAQPDAEKISMIEGDRRTFSLNVQDEDKKQPTFEWYLDNKRISSAKTYTYKPDFDSAGTHTLVGRVVDKEFVRRHTWQITVEETRRPFALSTIRQREAEEGDRVRFRVEVSNPDSRPLTLSASGLPKGATFDPDTRYFDWRVTYGQGGRVYDVVFTAKDAFGYTDTRTATINVAYEDVEPDFHRLYDLRAGLQQQAQSDRAVVVQSTQQAAQTQLPQQLLHLINATPVCVPGYLCYTITSIR